ncbi:MAG: helix-turn-helix domain-containing protein [Bacilli bacterium]
MGFSYKPLWKVLIDREMTKEELRQGVGLSSATIARMGKNEPVSMDVLDRICAYLRCSLQDVVERMPNSEE